MKKNKSKPEVVYKKTKKYYLNLETGERILIQPCPVRFLAKSKQYTLPEEKK